MSHDDNWDGDYTFTEEELKEMDGFKKPNLSTSLKISHLHPESIYCVRVHDNTPPYDLIFRFKRIIQDDPDRVIASYVSEDHNTAGFVKEGTPWLTGRFVKHANPEEAHWLHTCEREGKYITRKRSKELWYIDDPKHLKVGEVYHITVEPGRPSSFGVVFRHSKYEHGDKRVTAASRITTDGQFTDHPSQPIITNRNLRVATLDELLWLSVAESKKKYVDFHDAMRSKTTAEIPNGVSRGPIGSVGYAKPDGLIYHAEMVMSSNVRLYYTDKDGNSKMSEGSSLDDAMKKAENFESIDYVVKD